MGLKKFIYVFLIVGFAVLSVSVALAGDFGWMTDFNKKAEADQSRFRERIADRFRVGTSEIDDVLKGVKNPAEAYMIFRCGEMSSTSTDHILKKYKSKKKKGWGAFAKSLGIKPGSKEFHALKRNHDMSENTNMRDNHKGKKEKKANKGKGKGKGKT